MLPQPGQRHLVDTGSTNFLANVFQCKPNTLSLLVVRIEEASTTQRRPGHGSDAMALAKIERSVEKGLGVQDGYPQLIRDQANVDPGAK